MEQTSHPDAKDLKLLKQETTKGLWPTPTIDLWGKKRSDNKTKAGGNDMS